jgi:GT2 family glycosyltransferase
MSAVSLVDHSSFGSNFARAILRRFEHGRFLVVGAKFQKLTSQFCSSACMLTRRKNFQQAGGFDVNVLGTLADVDLCLKMRRAGFLIVCKALLAWEPM